MTAARDEAPPLAAAVAKVRRRVLPLLVVMFVVNYLDRVNVGFIKAPLAAALGIDAAAFGFGAGLFFIGYLLFEVPSNLALERFGGRVWLARIAISWGLVAAAMAFVQTAWQFHVGRFILGAAEAGFFPGVVYYLTRWLPQRERGRAMAVFLSGSAIASILSGPLAGVLMRIEGLGLAGWQWMLVIEGLASVAVGLAAGWWLDAQPRDALWLTAAEREALDAAIAGDTPAARHGKPRFVDLLRDPQVALFCGVYFAIQLTIYAVTFWLPSIIREQGGLSDLEVGLLNSVPWLVAIVGMVVAARAAERWPYQQAWVAVALAIAATGMVAATTGGPLLAYVAICFAALGFKSAASLFWPLPQGYLDPRAAAAGIALINSVGNLGGFVAPTVFGILEHRTGSIRGGLLGLAAASAATAGLVLLARSRPLSPAAGIQPP
ncbi:MAG: MFS transporter [Planctomycetaceae bacterium]